MNPFTNLTVWVVLANVFVWGSVVRFGFVWDDHPSIETNASLRSASILWRAFTSDFWGLHDRAAASGYYRPWVTVTTAIVGWMSGFSPWAFHLLSLALHVANSLFVVSILRRFDVGAFAALAGALWFSLHPLHAETIGFASALPDLWCAFFVLASLRLALEPPSWKRTLLWVVAWTGALASKETALVAFPVVLLVTGIRKEPRRSILQNGIVFLSIAGAAWVARVWILGGWGATGGSWTRAMELLPAYLGTAILPTGISPIRAEPRIFSIVLGALVLVAWVAWISRSQPSNRKGPIAAGIAFLSFWAPYSGILAIKGVWADRYFYLVLFACAWVLALALDRAGAIRARKIAGGWIVAMAVWSAVAIQAWRSDQTLWARALIANPSSSTVLNQNGILALEAGDFQGAAERFHAALALDASDTDARANEIVATLRARNFSRAQELAKTMRSLEPSDPRGYDFGAAAASAQGGWEEARALQKEAIRLAPEDWKYRYNWGLMESVQGRADDALEAFDLAWERATPIAEARRSVLRACAATASAAGLWKRARDCLVRLRDEDPKDPGVAKELERVERVLALVGEGP